MNSLVFKGINTAKIFKNVDMLVFDGNNCE